MFSGDYSINEPILLLINPSWLILNYMPRICRSGTISVSLFYHQNLLHASAARFLDRLKPTDNCYLCVLASFPYSSVSNSLLILCVHEWLRNWWRRHKPRALTTDNNTFTSILMSSWETVLIGTGIWMWSKSRKRLTSRFITVKLMRCSVCTPFFCQALSSVSPH